MTILVFDYSYHNFVEWRTRNLPLLGVDHTLNFVGNDTDRYLSISRNSFYIKNYPLTENEENLVKRLALKEIQLIKEP